LVFLTFNFNSNFIYQCCLPLFIIHHFMAADLAYLK
jgi:hypothetical protein